MRGGGGGADSFSRNAQNRDYKDGAGGSRPAGRALSPPRLLSFPASRHARTRARKLAGTTCRQTDIGGRRRASLVDELLAVDVAQALEEGERAERVGVSNLHVARHSPNQPHEGLQLRRDVI